jgi:predicted kinase
MCSLTLIRGLPGSGKSTLAKKLAAADNLLHFEADNYFIANGHYCFRADRLYDAHRICQERTATALNAGNSVVVSNTFTSLWEFEPYFEIATKIGIVPNVIQCSGHFGSIHDIPTEKYQQMKNRWVHDISSLWNEMPAN